MAPQERPRSSGLINYLTQICLTMGSWWRCVSVPERVHHRVPEKPQPVEGPPRTSAPKAPKATARRSQEFLTTFPLAGRDCRTPRARRGEGEDEEEMETQERMKRGGRGKRQKRRRRKRRRQIARPPRVPLLLLPSPLALFPVRALHGNASWRARPRACRERRRPEQRT